MNAKRTTVALVALQALLAGCGNDDSADSDTGASAAVACARFDDANDATKGASPDLAAAGAELAAAIDAATDSDDVALAAAGERLRRTLDSDDTAGFAIALVDFGARCDELDP